MTLPYVPKIIQWCYPKRIWHKSRQEKTIYLTFDDGPIPEITPWVLKQLKEYDAKATFFCIGENIKKNTEVFQQILENGHSIGNHTFNHLDGWKTATKTYLDNVELCASEISQLTTEVSHLFRPPYGKLTSKQSKILQQKGYKIVMWDVLSVDYDQNVSKEKCLQNVLKHTKNGSIIIFHDSLKAEKNLRYVLPQALEHFSKEGFSFKKL